MHKAVKEWCMGIKGKFPEYFQNKTVLDAGSLDINGNNRYLFEGGQYHGVDLAEGKNVDFVSPIRYFKPANQLYDVVISTEMLEHDREYAASLKQLYLLLKSGGLMLLTAAGTGRAEHGTSGNHPGNSPETHDYYKNITVRMLCRGISFANFSWFEISYQNNDIRFAGIKR